MFYFGGMTLGYLTPPERSAERKQDKIVVARGQDDQSSVPVEQAQDNKGLLARSNWYSLNG